MPIDPGIANFIASGQQDEAYKDEARDRVALLESEYEELTDSEKMRADALIGILYEQVLIPQKPNVEALALADAAGLIADSRQKRMERGNKRAGIRFKRTQTRVSSELMIILSRRSQRYGSKTGILK